MIITSNAMNFLSVPKGKVANKERGTASLSYVWGSGLPNMMDKRNSPRLYLHGFEKHVYTKRGRYRLLTPSYFEIVQIPNNRDNTLNALLILYEQDKCIKIDYLGKG